MTARLVVWALTLKARLSDARGQDIMEYAILTGGIAIVAIATIGLFGGALDDWFNRLINYVTGLMPGEPSD